jgi:hypothetical protein
MNTSPAKGRRIHVAYVAKISVYFQWLPLTAGNSVRHGRDMTRKAEPPLNPLAAVMIWVFVLGTGAEALQLGARECDVRKFCDDFAGNLRRQYDRKVRAQALRLRRRWRKADVPRLAELFLLPGLASPAIQRSIARLMLTADSGGRRVVSESKEVEQAFAESLNVWSRMIDPGTSPHDRRKIRKALPKWPGLVEAAYRGQLAEEKQRKIPHQEPAKIAEDKVAEAAGISPHTVHQLCQQVRDEHKWAVELADTRRRRLPHLPGQWVEPEPAMTAADLKRYLERGPADLGPELAQPRDLK